MHVVVELRLELGDAAEREAHVRLRLRVVRLELLETRGQIGAPPLRVLQFVLRVRQVLSQLAGLLCGALLALALGLQLLSRRLLLLQTTMTFQSISTRTCTGTNI